MSEAQQWLIFLPVLVFLVGCGLALIFMGGEE